MARQTQHRPRRGRRRATGARPASGATEALVALGGNIGDVLAAFRTALAALEARGVDVLAVSSAYRTTAVQPEGVASPAPDYWNAAARVRTTLCAAELLRVLLALEREAGRERRAGRRWEPRSLDLDLLTYGALVVDEPFLQVPHPRLAERLFVLLPLAEVAADDVVPGHGVTVAALLARLGGTRDGVLECRRGWQAQPE